MQNKTVIKLILDIAMALLFVVLIYPRTTGMSFHEIAGLVIGLLLLGHLALNWSWIKAMTMNLLKPNMKAKSRWFYILDSLSLLAVVVIIITGVEISQVLFASGGGGNRSALFSLHKWISYGSLGLFGVHVALHWNFIVTASRKLFAAWHWLKFGKAATAIASMALILGLVYAQLPSPTSADQEQVYRREAYAYSDPTATTPATTQEQPKVASKGAGRQGHTYNNNSSVSSAIPAPSQSEQQIVTSPNNAATDTISLADYLDNLFCTGCERRCSLLRPECGIGVQQAQIATQKYQQTYGADA